jgi:uncharacterized lipoprotein YmbA
MKKYIIALILISLASCATTKQATKTFSFRDEVNNSIIDGFYGGDKTQLSKDVFLLKN